MNELYKARCKKIELKESENSFKKLQEDYEKVARQRDYTTNAQDINNFERQLKEILEALEKVGRECDLLQEEIQRIEASKTNSTVSEPLQALVSLLAPINFETVTKAYVSCLSDGRPRSVPETLEALVRQLTEIPGDPGELKPLQRFVSLLLQEESLGLDLKKSLRAWAQAQGLPPITPDSALACPPVVETLLMVKVKPRSLNNPALGYLLSAAIVKDPEPLKPDVETLSTSIAIPDGTTPECAPGYSKNELPDVLNELIATCGREHGIPLTDLTVQWFLPIELMSLPIEHWQIQIGRSQRQCSGQRCRSVIVRSYDRHFSPDYQVATGDWEKYWKRLLDCVESRCSKTLHPLNPMMGHVAIDWNNPKIIGCKFVEHEEPKQQEEFWDNLLGQGVPVALWMRQPGVPPQSAKKMMQIVMKYSISALPIALAEQRQKALSHPSEANRLKAAPLCLLFDNPFRPFPSIDYQSA